MIKTYTQEPILNDPDNGLQREETAALDEATAARPPLDEAM